MSLTKKLSRDLPECTVSFKLETSIAPHAREVRILGDFNDWKWERGIVMKKKGDFYVAELSLPIGKVYEYRYLIDNERWENDEAADAYHPSPFDGINNCVIDLVNVEIPTKTRGRKTFDLTMIEGIGPKIKGILKQEGVETFADLATSEVRKLKDILLRAGARYKMHDPSSWPEQAGLAAKGKWEELKLLQGDLKGGRR